MLDALQARPGCLQLPKSAVHRGCLPQAAHLKVLPACCRKARPSLRGRLPLTHGPPPLWLLHVRQERPGKLSQGALCAAVLLQVQDDCPGNLTQYYRHISKGAWPFSTRDHGWPISDCSSEGLKVSGISLASPAMAGALASWGLQGGR